MNGEQNQNIGEETEAGDPDHSHRRSSNPWRWVWRIVALSLFFYLLGYFSHPVTAPLMCKIYG